MSTLPSPSPGPVATRPAVRITPQLVARCRERGIPLDAVRRVMAEGRCVYRTSRLEFWGMAGTSVQVVVRDGVADSACFRTSGGHRARSRRQTPSEGPTVCQTKHYRGHPPRCTCEGTPAITPAPSPPGSYDDTDAALVIRGEAGGPAPTEAMPEDDDELDDYLAECEASVRLLSPGGLIVIAIVGLGVFAVAVRIFVAMDGWLAG